MQTMATRNTLRARVFAAASFLLAGAANACWSTQARAQYPSTGISAVPTYEAVGLYWSGAGAKVSSTGRSSSKRSRGPRHHDGERAAFGACHTAAHRRVESDDCALG